MTITDIPGKGKSTVVKGATNVVNQEMVNKIALLRMGTTGTTIFSYLELRVIKF